MNKQAAYDSSCNRERPTARPEAEPRRVEVRQLRVVTSCIGVERSDVQHLNAAIAIELSHREVRYRRHRCKTCGSAGIASSIGLSWRYSQHHESSVHRCYSLRGHAASTVARGLCMGCNHFLSGRRVVSLRNEAKFRRGVEWTYASYLSMSSSVPQTPSSSSSLGPDTTEVARLSL